MSDSAELGLRAMLAESALPYNRLFALPIVRILSKYIIRISKINADFRLKPLTELRTEIVTDVPSDQ